MKNGAPFDGSAYSNFPSATWREHTRMELVKHFFMTRDPAIPSDIDVRMPVLRPSFPQPPKGQIAVTWLGHATMYADIDGFKAIFDPVFDEYVGTFYYPIYRDREAPAAIAEIPRCDAAFISHDHFDHASPPAIGALSKAWKSMHWFVPAGLTEWMVKQGASRDRIHELGWNESVEFTGSSGKKATITFVPSQHWSGRGIVRNQTLWGGWIVNGVYHVGDTGDADIFDEIGKRYGPFEVVFLPIGSCDPQTFMAPHHVNASGAATVRTRLGNPYAIAMHYGTFRLKSTDTCYSPRDELDDLQVRGFDWIHHGQSFVIPKRT